MDGFSDLKILCFEGESTHAVLGKVYSALHLELVERQSNDIGVSFPSSTQNNMGDVLRVHGLNKTLDGLLNTNRLTRLADYFRGADIKRYPSEHTWKFVKRVQPKLTAAKARRMVRRGSASEERAQALFDQGPSKLKIPYLNMNSGSTGQRYRLYVNHVDCETPIKVQSFNSFGLGACVPWF